jgi:hypothetical protein
MRPDSLLFKLHIFIHLILLTNLNFQFSYIRLIYVHIYQLMMMVLQCAVENER